MVKILSFQEGRVLLRVRAVKGGLRARATASPNSLLRESIQDTQPVGQVFTGCFRNGGDPAAGTVAGQVAG